MLVSAIYFGVLGAVVGSFLNVVVLRHGKRSIGGRSSCPSCGAKLAWYDLVPVFSWLALGGRCRSCHARISIQYPLVELATALAFAGIGGALFPHGVANISYSSWSVALLDLTAAGLLIAILVYDLYHMIIPDEWVFLFGATALVSSLITVGSTGALAAVLSGPLVASPLYVLWLVSGGKWMGLGDPKLALGIGWLLGAAAGFIAVLFAFIIGAVVSVFVLIPLSSLHRNVKHITMKSEVPFGPFLVVSTFAVWFAVLYKVQPAILSLFS